MRARALIAAVFGTIWLGTASADDADDGSVSPPGPIAFVLLDRPAGESVVAASGAAILGEGEALYALDLFGQLSLFDAFAVYGGVAGYRGPRDCPEPCSPGGESERTSVGGVQLGAAYARSLSPAAELIGRLGVVTPTGSDDLHPRISWRYADFASATPQSLWLSTSSSAAVRDWLGIEELRFDVGADIPLDTPQTAPMMSSSGQTDPVLLRVGFGVARSLSSRFTATMSVERTIVIGDDFYGAEGGLYQAAASGRFTLGPVTPHVSVGSARGFGDRYLIVLGAVMAL